MLFSAPWTKTSKMPAALAHGSPAMLASKLLTSTLNCMRD